MRKNIRNLILWVILSVILSLGVIYIGMYANVPASFLEFPRAVWSWIGGVIG